MPPKQCPNCGRFLKNALVEALAEGPQPCPGCDEPLTAAGLDEERVGTTDEQERVGTTADQQRAGTTADQQRAGTTDDQQRAGTTDDEGTSVRPPDLQPGDVRDDASDVLEGWDRGADAAEIAAWNEDQPPFPTDTVVVVGGGLVGALLGALTSHRRVRGGLLGGLAGVVVAALVRRIWRLPD